MNEQVNPGQMSYAIRIHETCEFCAGSYVESVPSGPIGYALTPDPEKALRFTSPALAETVRKRFARHMQGGVIGPAAEVVPFPPAAVLEAQ